MGKNYDVIIIGAGIVGCSVAFELASRGIKKILIVERKYATSGNTGKCGAGIRQQWGSPLNATLAYESTNIFEHLEELTGYGHSCGLNQTGYLLIACNEAEWRQFQANIPVQHKICIKSYTVDLDKEIFKIVPHINTEGLVGAVYCHEDGSADPFHCTLAYLQGAKRLGAEILTYTEVKELIAEGGKIKGVRTTKGDFFAPRVINCANQWAPELAKQVGDEIPITPERHQAVITEPVAPMGYDNSAMPMVMSWERRFFCQQTLHGSFIMGEIEAVPTTAGEANWDYLESNCNTITTTLPALRQLRVLRHWAGHFDMSPDHTPIITFSKNAEGLLTICGFSGHGFMISPRTAVMVARKICGEKDTIDINKFEVERFKTGALLLEPMAL